MKKRRRDAGKNRKKAMQQMLHRRILSKSLAEFAPAGANKVKIIFSGGKWVRLQEHKRSAARLAKSNPCSAYVGENTFRPASVEFLR